jgi:uncharacterized protein
MGDSLSADDLARVVRVYRGALAEYRADLNRLNVYPVPDGDTGTNMTLTMEAVEREMDEAEAQGRSLDLGVLGQCLSHGSLMGARGNSGVILSQVLRGLAGAFNEAGEGSQGGAELGAAQLADALSRASESAYAAVSNPVEGTILTVARAAGRGAEDALKTGSGATVSRVLEAARDAAAAALAGTTQQLPALRAAGVVDAGGAGLLLLLDSFLHVVEGRPLEAPPAPLGARKGSREALAGPMEASGRAGPGGEHEAAAPLRAAGHGAGEGHVADVGDLRYEVMFFLDAADDSIPGFRRVWAGYGGSIVIVGGDGVYKCHIHTDDIGGAIEAAIEIGRPREIRVTDLAEQVEEERWVRDAAASGTQLEPPGEPVTSAVVAVCAGDGVKRIFRSLGARQIVAGGQSANPSTEEILDAIVAAPAEQVLVLPNNPNVVAVAEQAAAHSAKKVRVVPTAGIPEGFAALLAYDPEADVDTNADNMAAAAAHVVSGQVARASRDAVTDAGPARSGDWLGISSSAIEVVAHQPATAADAAIGLLDVLIPDHHDHEIVTLIEGEGAHAPETRRIVEWLSEKRPGISAEVHHGGQPVYPYLFSIE